VSGIAGSLFRGPAVVIVQLALLAIGGWLLAYVTTALGKGQLSNLINLTVLLVGFILVIGVVVTALGKVATVLGL
jgi:hypothetical protein